MAAPTLQVDQLPVSGLSRECFVSEEHFALELEHIFRPRWLYAGHVSQLPEPGSWLRFDLGSDSVIVMRGEDGAVRAMHNTCRHRGAELLAERAGRCPAAIVCPYHGWSYRFDGSLRGTPQMQEGFSPEGLDLKPVWADVWQGLIFVSLAESRPPSVAEQVTTAGSLDAYALERMKVAWTREQTVEANWKILWENGLECYHCALNHPELKTVVDIFVDGMDEDEFEPHDYEYNEDFPLLPNARSVTRTGDLAVRRPLGDAAVPPEGIKFLQWHLAAFELIAAPDHAHVMLYQPLSATRSTVRTIGFVHEDAEEGVDYDLEELSELHRLTRGQDDALCERVQRGVTSPAYEPGPYNHFYEFPNRNFVRVYREALDAISGGAGR